MKSSDNKFIVMKADKVDFDVREQISEISSEGFTQWLVFFSKDKKTIAKAFAHMFVLDQFYVAIANNKIAAITACTDGYTSSVKLNKKELREHLGFFKGTMAKLFLTKEFESPLDNPSPETCSIEFVGTATAFQGQGAASQLLSHIIETTSFQEYVIKEVADTNVPAMRLYTKFGFKEYERKAAQKMAKKSGINYMLSLKYVKAK